MGRYDWLTVCAIIISVLLTSVSQLVLRAGMRGVSLSADVSRAADLWALVFSPYIIGGLILFGSSAVTWLFVLSRVPVSFAYPFVGLGIVLTTLGGVALLGEHVTKGQLLSIGIILIGIISLGLSD